MGSVEEPCVEDAGWECYGVVEIFLQLPDIDKLYAM